MITVQLQTNSTEIVEVRLPQNIFVNGFTHRTVLEFESRLFVYSGMRYGIPVLIETGDCHDISEYMPGFKGGTLTCIGGDIMDIHNPDPTMIRIKDIATILGRIARYNNHGLIHYSVAEHSVLVYHYLRGMGCSDMVCATGLMHDAPEYLIGDIIKPVKDRIGKTVKQMEGRIWQIIANKYGLLDEIPEEVLEADRRIVHNEGQQLFAANWDIVGGSLPGVNLKFHDAENAALEFAKCAVECGLTKYDGEVK